jgi:hypothetical protein
MGRSCSTNGAKRNSYKILVEKPEGRDNYEDQDVGEWFNIKVDLTETGWGGTGWIDLAQDKDQWRALVNTVMNPHVP